MVLSKERRNPVMKNLLLKISKNISMVVQEYWRLQQLQLNFQYLFSLSHFVSNLLVEQFP